MVVKKKSTSEAKVKINKLKVNKETVKDLGKQEASEIKGGRQPFETAGCLSVNACGTAATKCCD